MDDTAETQSGGPIHRSRSFWFDHTASYGSSAPLRCDHVADVCVIGGGINGLSAAYHLRRADAGCDVAVLEAEAVGFGASGRNAGQLIVAFGANDFRPHLRRFGAERMGQGWRYVAHGLTRIEEFMADAGVDCDYAPTGYIEAHLRQESPAFYDRYREYVAAIGQGAAKTMLSIEEMADEFDTPYLGAGLHDSRGGQINPLKLLRHLKSEAERLGARCYENSPVIDIDVSGPRIRISTGMGTVTCSKLVLASNAYTHLLAGLDGIGASTIQRPMLIRASITAPLTSAQWEAVGWSRRCGVNVLSELFYSFAPTRDGRLLYVCGHYATRPGNGGMGPEISPAFIATGPTHLGQFFPALRGIRSAQSWGGAISLTVDGIPHIGVSRDPRILYACGCWGHGMPIGMENGATLADLALERSGANTDAWFVRSPKRHWPNPTLADFVLDRANSMHRRTYRRRGAALTPPLRF